MEEVCNKPIAVLGAGSWGTALALYLARRGQLVKIWSIDTSEITAMLADRANNRYLPDIALPDTLHPIADLADTVKGMEDILIAVPSVGFRHTLTLLKPLLSPNARIICATKGLEEETGRLLDDVVAEVLGDSHAFAVLSGPSFAREVAVGLPTAVNIASKHADFIHALKQRFNSAIFRVYPSSDVKGVEIGGVVKNVIAIATGMSDGMDYGANARCALITHGLAEITRLGVALGAKAETLTSLAGMGDLILTCTDNQSRNRRMGLALGKGQPVAEAEKAIGQVVEGKRNAEIVVKLADKLKISMPVCHMVWDVLQGKASAKEAMEKLMRSNT